jgi:hypothetical protein
MHQRRLVGRARGKEEQGYRRAEKEAAAVKGGGGKGKGGAAVVAKRTPAQVLQDKNDKLRAAAIAAGETGYSAEPAAGKKKRPWISFAGDVETVQQTQHAAGGRARVPKAVAGRNVSVAGGNGAGGKGARGGARGRVADTVIASDAWGESDVEGSGGDDGGSSSGDDV